MEVKRILERVNEQMSVLNLEFKEKKVRWVIYQQSLVDNKLRLVVKMKKNDTIITAKFLIWPHNLDSYYLHNEDKAEPIVVLYEQLVKLMALEINGGQIVGTSLTDNDWWRKHVKHLSLVPIT